ncbi:hypothetical protein EBZ80_18910, partial [bacterium]|nr:hypothetical protein [bacterium]
MAHTIDASKYSNTVKWEKTISDVNDEILVNLRNPHPSFYVAFAIAALALLTAIGFVAAHTIVGLGLWNFAPPLYWAVDI